MGSIEVTVNGTRHRLQPSGRTAVEVLRDDLGLTGTKLSCGNGLCGACTVWLDGVPAVSCVTPAEALDGREVLTVEGLSADGLHPVQHALLAHDGLQCGFCTPGMVMAAAAFYETWRARHGERRPSRDDVADALAGNLCRCGASAAIIGAVQDACEGRYDGPGPYPRPRVDGLDKVTGAARYTDDLRLDGMLEGVILRSTEPHADVLAVRIDDALALPGVRGYADLLGKGRRVRYTGQPIGVVAAVDRATALAALDVIEVVYAPLPAAIGLEAALAPNAPNTHLRRWSPPSNNEAKPTPARYHGNARGPQFAFSKRRFTARRTVAAARRRRDPLLVEETFRIPSQVHAAPEPHVAIARWEGDTVTVWASTQSISSLRRKLARRYRCEVRVVAHHVGGAYGAKQSITDEIVAAVEAARVADAPVRVRFDQTEDLSYSGHRPGDRIDLALLGSAAGDLRAVTATAYADGGASAGQTVAGLLRITYPGAPMSLLDYDVVSNAPPGKPFRAPGFPQALVALEQAVDELALRLGEDPVKLRRRWSRRPLRQAVYDRIAAHPLWRDRPGFGSQRGRHRLGVGVAFGTWYYGYDPTVRVAVSVEQGRLRVSTALQDMGQGAYTVIATAVAEVFGVALDDVDVNAGDSRLGRGPTSSASRTSPSVFPTAAAAAELLRDELVEAAAELFGGPVEPVPGGITHAGEMIPWPDVFTRLGDRRVEAGRPKDGHFPATPFPVEGVQIGWGLSDVGHLVEVEVDTRYGVVRPRRVYVVLAAGRIYVPELARSQVEGGVMQGIGLALHEERRFDHRSGLVLTADVGSYRYPAMGDTPEIEVEFLEEGFEHAPGGGAGIAELAITAAPAATVNAVAHAVGHRFPELPLRPDRVLEALG